jgi:hypothetical protein
MQSADWLLADRDRHLKWPALDIVERALMIACGIAVACFSPPCFAM